MKNFFIGLIVGIVSIPVLALLYIWSGHAPVATAAPPLPFEETLAKMALHARIAREAPTESPVPPTEPNVMAGAKVYRQNCAGCHGLAGEPKTPAAMGMFPPPPQLLHGTGVTDDPAGETFWKATNGIRLTGMPAYQDSLTVEQRWQVSQFLATADKLPQSVKDFLAQAPPVN